MSKLLIKLPRTLKKYFNFRKLDADSSTDTSTTKKEDTNQILLTPAVNKNIINYQNDSLSIASVHGTTAVVSQISPQLINTNPSMSNKISLVPTKLLLKSQTGFKAPPPLVTPTSTITTNAQSSQCMKVVFVNALNSSQHAQHAGKQQIITLNKTQAQQIQNQTSNQAFITNKIIGQAQPTKVQLVNQMPSISVPCESTPPNNIAKVSAATSSHKSSEGNKKKSSKSILGSNKLPGRLIKKYFKINYQFILAVIRNLLTNIVEIENQRLEIEKQRFEYEKKVGSELLSLLKTFVGSKGGTEESNPNKS